MQCVNKRVKHTHSRSGTLHEVMHQNINFYSKDFISFFLMSIYYPIFLGWGVKKIIIKISFLCNIKVYLTSENQLITKHLQIYTLINVYMHQHRHRHMYMHIHIHIYIHKHTRIKNVRTNKWISFINILNFTQNIKKLSSSLLSSSKTGSIFFKVKMMVRISVVSLFLLNI